VHHYEGGGGNISRLAWRGNGGCLGNPRLRKRGSERERERKRERQEGKEEQVKWVKRVDRSIVVVSQFVFVLI